MKNNHFPASTIIFFDKIGFYDCFFRFQSLILIVFDVIVNGGRRKTP